jgi:zinc protease
VISLKRVLSVVVIAVTMTACTNPESSTSSATQESKALKIEKFQLKNGLDVVLHQDKSDPVVAVAIVYHVGSNRELSGKTGFAHFFEHMLFQNSTNVGAGKFIQNIGNMGGTLNGGTWQDGTIYYEVGPNDG